MDGRVLAAIAALKAPVSGGALWLMLADDPHEIERRQQSFWWWLLPMRWQRRLVWTVNVYPSLLHLELAGLITSEWADEPKPRRRMYALAREI